MKMTINPAQVKAKVANAWREGLYGLTTEILADCNQFVKRSPNHTMRDSSLTASRPSEGIIAWDTPYAKRQYWAIQTALTPGTTWRWMETAKRHYYPKWKAQAQRGFISNL